MKIKPKPGMAVTLKDSYFRRHNQPHLFGNHETQRYGKGGRPYVIAFEDKKISGIWWAIPLSSRNEKYKKIARQKTSKFGRCYTLLPTVLNRKRSTLLIQNMVPITANSIYEICKTNEGHPVHIPRADLKQAIIYAKRVLSMRDAGIDLIFTKCDPIMHELASDIIKSHQRKIRNAYRKPGSSQTLDNPKDRKRSGRDKIEAAKAEAAKRNSKRANHVNKNEHER